MSAFAPLATIPDAGADSPQPSLEVQNLSDIKAAAEGDREELLQRRFLCRGSALLVVAPTHVGKSVFVLQCAILWSFGLPAFGIKPTRKLKVLIIQAENDDGDIAEMRDGILSGLNLDIPEADQGMIKVVTIEFPTGFAFCNSVLEPLLNQHRPDLIAIDPALAYLGGESNQQRDVAEFIRGGIAPLLHKYECGLILVHHTSKPLQTDRKSRSNTEMAYLGSGSAEWANWPRAILVIQQVRRGVFELHAAKRGSRLDWQDEHGERQFVKVIAHASDGIYWQELTSTEVGESREARFAQARPSMDQFLELFPTDECDPEKALLSADQIKAAFCARGWDKNTYPACCKEAEERGALKQIRGKGRGGKVLRGRPQAVRVAEERQQPNLKPHEEPPTS